jgi:hypothetical protein
MSSIMCAAHIGSATDQQPCFNVPVIRWLDKYVDGSVLCSAVCLQVLTKDDIKVVQEGGDVALRGWLAAAGDTMGGDALVGNTCSGMQRR